MDTLGYILFFTLLGSVFSLIGGIILLAKEKLALKISHYLASFAAGALLGTAFFDLLPEAFEEAERTGADTNIFFWALMGVLTFFLLERFIHWFHHHHEHNAEEKKSIVPLVVLGDTVHNFLDGVVIAATFLVSVPLGMVTALAVAAHEIPQEIGDFGILLHRGLKRKKVIFINLMSAIGALVGAVITYLIGERIETIMPILLSITAGFFLYIAASDLIPEIHNEDNKKVALIETVLLLLGVFIIWYLVSLLEGFTKTSNGSGFLFLFTANK